VQLSADLAICGFYPTSFWCDISYLVDYVSSLLHCVKVFLDRLLLRLLPLVSIAELALVDRISEKPYVQRGG